MVNFLQNFFIIASMHLSNDNDKEVLAQLLGHYPLKTKRNAINNYEIRSTIM